FSGLPNARTLRTDANDHGRPGARTRASHPHEPEPVGNRPVDDRPSRELRREVLPDDRARRREGRERDRRVVAHRRSARRERRVVDDVVPVDPLVRRELDEDVERSARRTEEVRDDVRAIVVADQSTNPVRDPVIDPARDELRTRDRPGSRGAYLDEGVVCNGHAVQVSSSEIDAYPATRDALRLSRASTHISARSIDISIAFSYSGEIPES